MAGRSLFHRGAGRAEAPQWVGRLIPFALFALAFVPRLAAIGRYVTPDEATWVYRSIQFREALLAGRWADTLVAGHPGVTTTWLGALGISAQLWLASGARSAYEWLTTMAYLTPDNVEAFRRLALFLDSGRVAVALVNSLGVVGVYLLARRLWDWRVGLVAGLLLALDPFLVGLSGLLHVDGLSATFVTLSLLALALSLRPEANGRAWGWAALAGSMAGLAALSKTPTLLLLPVSGLGLLWPLARDRHLPWRARLSIFLRRSAAWGLAFVLTAVALYPALWVAPGTVAATVGGSANRHLDEALRETFFLGRTAFDHGPLFYPVVLLWRLSPVVWLALIPVVLWLAGRWAKERRLSGDAFPIVLLGVWVVAFLLAITPAAKKFDRYILPAVPVLLLLAAVAWAGWARGRPRVGRWIVLAVVFAQALFWLVFAAYPLTAYNPLVGGPYTAARVLPIGWGEGIGAAGRRLSLSQPAAEQERAISGIAPSLAPFFSGQTLVDGWDDPATADYAIVTLGGRQLDPAGVQARTAGLELLLTEHFGGLDQAWVYRQTPQPPAIPPALSEPVVYGDRMALTAAALSTGADKVELAARWRRLAASADDRYALRIVIRDEQGNVWATEETDLLNEVYFFPPDWQVDETGVVRYPLELPPGIPPGRYEIALSLIDNRTAGQLPVRVGEEGFQGVAYSVGEIDVPPPEQIVSASRLRIDVPHGATWLDGSLQLLGRGEGAAEGLAGSQLPVDLFWHAPGGEPPDGLGLAWQLLPLDGGESRTIHTGALSRYDTGLWRVGETIQEKYLVPLPPDLPAGRYQLAVQPMRPDGESIGVPAELMELQINNIDRAYELPADIPVEMAVAWEPLHLLGLSPGDLTGEPGGSADLTLYWQKQAAHGDVYTAFVHLLDENGAIVAQADHWPGGLPTDILDAGQVVTDRVSLALPAELPPGEYDIRVGLYSTETGQRLPIVHAGENTVVEQEYILLPVRLQVTSP